MKRKTALVAGSIATAAALGLGLPALASAGPDDSGSSSAPGVAQRQEWREEMHDELAQRLADELGLPASTVSDALDKVMDQMRTEHRAERLDTLRERLDQAVENGTLTRKRADAIYDAVKEGVGPWFGEGGMGMGHGHGFGHGPGGMGLGMGMGLGGPST